MRLLRALSLAAAVSFANAAVACPTDIPHDLSKVEVTAPSQDIVLINHEDDAPPASQSVTATANASPDWAQIELLPSAADFDGFDLSFRILVDDEGEPLMMDVASTGSVVNAPEEAHLALSLALDGYEDR
jgi:hypothetical protein